MRSAVGHILRNHPFLLAGGGIVMALIVAALLAPLLAPYDPIAVNALHILEPPSVRHWAGTDELGRDLFSRILWGARPSLSVAFGVVLIASLPGILIGCFSGLAGGLIDTLIMRLVDMIMSLPGLVIALALVAVLGPSLVNLTVALGVLAIPYYVRVARGQTLSIRSKSFVIAAETLGASKLFILFRHVLPNLAPGMVVLGSLSMSNALIAASALSFIGLGAQPPMAEWGAILQAGQRQILDAWWYTTLPGLAILIAAVGFNLLGDGLRDLLDPKV